MLPWIYAALRSLILIAAIAVAAAWIAPTGTAVQTPLRSTIDRPDDVTGFQIHLIYALPKDGSDQQLDTNGVIATNVEAWESWVAGQTGGERIRLDTYQNAPDITFSHLSRSDVEMESFGNYLRDTVEAELVAAGFDDSQKIYAIFYGGTSHSGCGGGAWPPTLLGSVAFLNQYGSDPRGGPPCPEDFTTSYREFSMIHEIIHTMGFVPTCATHQILAGHVGDSKQDLMYAGPLPWEPSALDVGHDDYYEAHIPGCLDFSSSAFLTPSVSSPVAPPGWPLSVLQAQECSLESSQKSNGNLTTAIQFINESSETVQVFWLDYNGSRKLYDTLKPLSSVSQSTFAGHLWLVADQQGHCKEIYVAMKKPARAVIK